MNDEIKSSTGSGKLSQTVKGILTSLIPVIVLLGQAFGVEISQAGAAEGIAVVAGLTGSVVALLGYIRAKNYAK